MSEIVESELEWTDEVRRMEHVLVIDQEMSVLNITENALQKNYRVSTFTSEDDA
ncbi:MAG: hypothetical protein GX359_12440, partial [Clostridiales bacterium]|nr:hypothetical protein [Clostridiales bacterium]